MKICPDVLILSPNREDYRFVSVRSSITGSSTLKPLAKLGASERTEAVTLAIKRGLIGLSWLIITS